MEVFFAPIGLVMEWPYLALGPAALFLVAYLSGRKRPPAPRVVLVAAVAWGLFAVYETYMRAWSKTVVAPIRVDLLLIGPVLYALTLAGAVGWWRHRRRAGRGAV